MNRNPPAFQPGALEMSMIGIGALLGLVSLILFIMIVVKMFQRNETAIGIISIVIFCIGGIGHLVALVYGWMKAGEWNIRGLMMTYTFTLLGSMIIGGAGYGIFISKMVNEIQNNPEFQEQMEQMQIEMQGLEDGLEVEVVEPAENVN